MPSVRRRLEGRPRPGRRIGARLRSVYRAERTAIRQSVAALVVASVASLLAGLTLGAITGTLEALPGLLVLVPAAIGMRGNIFGALGSRLGTSMHSGTFTLTRRADTVVGQNVAAALALSLAVSLALAVLAKAVAVGFGLAGTISIADFVVISVIGGMLSSVLVLAMTVGVAALAAGRGWDMDNVAAPLVTAAGDVVTLPSLFVATALAGVDQVTPVLSVVLAAGSAAALVASLRAGLPLLARIVRESMPVLLAAGLVDVMAGLTIEKRLSSFVAFPALLVLIPPFLEAAGALGGILSSRLSTKLHLGVLSPSAVPPQPARDDFVLILLYALPVFTVVSLSADLAARLAGRASPGVLRMLAVSLSGGLVATVSVMGIAYYGAMIAHRLGLDPDTHGIPLVTSSMDLVGAFALILAIVALGIA